jgi:hypothetical protein
MTNFVLAVRFERPRREKRYFYNESERFLYLAGSSARVSFPPVRPNFSLLARFQG